MAQRRPHIVIVVVNLPAERDRRVVRQCQALESAGYRVSVICPRGPQRPRTLPGTVATRIRSFPQPPAGRWTLSFAAEFVWDLVAVTAHLLALMLRDRVDAVQVRNQADVFWPLALLLRAAGRPFVFDHHGLSPELYECETDRPRPMVLRILRLLEKLSWRCASAVISTNESYRELAITRGGCAPDRVVAVRDAPTLAEGRHDGIPAPRGAGEQERHTLVHLGVISPQDHVEAVVLTAERLVHLRGRDDWRVVVAGDGESLPQLRRLADERDLADVVTFTGRLEADEVGALLRSATIAVQPDPPTRMAQLSTMAKTVEYVARGLPVVAVDMPETRRTAGEAARYVRTGDPDELAKAVDQLLADSGARAEMQRVARSRFATELAWDHQVKAYLELWRRLMPATPAAPAVTATEESVAADRRGRG